MNVRFFKSPFSKGGFREIIKWLSNPPLPPFRKGGVKAVVLNAIVIMKRHTSDKYLHFMQ